MLAQVERAQQPDRWWKCETTRRRVILLSYVGATSIALALAPSWIGYAFSAGWAMGILSECWIRTGRPC